MYTFLPVLMALPTWVLLGGFIVGCASIFLVAVLYLRRSTRRDASSPTSEPSPLKTNFAPGQPWLDNTATEKSEATASGFAKSVDSNGLSLNESSTSPFSTSNSASTPSSDNTQPTKVMPATYTVEIALRKINEADGSVEHETVSRAKKLTHEESKATVKDAAPHLVAAAMVLNENDAE